MLNHNVHIYNSLFGNACLNGHCNRVVSDNDMDNTDIYPVDCCEYACEDPIKVDTEMSICNSVLDT